MPTKTNASTTLPTAASLAEQLGVAFKPALTPLQIQRLRRALPGYVALLDDVADLLDRDAAALNFKETTPDELMELQKKHRSLSQVEALLEALHASVYHQRLQIDNDAMGLLQKLARRVQSRSEEDPQLPLRWKTLLDFLGTFRSGGRSPAEPPAEPTPLGPSPEG